MVFPLFGQIGKFVKIGKALRGLTNFKVFFLWIFGV